MKLEFTKMHSLGNDFMVIDTRNQILPEKLEDFVKKAAHRNFGLGFDQAVLISSGIKSPVSVGFYNRDGSRAEFCGNGVRCAAKFAFRQGIVHCREFQMEIGKKTVSVNLQDGNPMVNLGIPEYESEHWNFEQNTENMDLSICGKVYQSCLVSMGNPHCVLFVPEDLSPDVDKIGNELQTHPGFPHGINVEFVFVRSQSEIDLRVFERGCGETMACGSGAAAAVAACVRNDRTQRKVLAFLPGGILGMEYTEQGILQTGAAEFVFDGVFSKDFIF